LRGDVSLEGGIFPLNAFIIFPMSKTRPVNAARFPQGEFENFTNLLDKLLSVPHSKIKAELDAEKRKKQTRRKRAAVGHAFRDAD
jgi:hypothetical protein